jgi:predicted dehydrogenase
MSTAPAFRAAVIGAGAGGKLSMKALHTSPRYELVAVADTRSAAREEAQATYPGIRSFGDHRTLLEACAVDVLCVSTWPPSHLSVTQDGLAAGLRGILVEKPLGDTYAAGAGVIAAIRAAGIPAVVPHGLLVADHGRAILERVAAGAIGALKIVEIECAGWDIINAGIHWLDFALSLLPGDQVVQVLAACDVSTRTYRDGMQVETEAVTYATTRSGVRIVMHTGDFVPVAEANEGTLFRLAGSRGLLEFFGWKPRYRLTTPAQPDGELIDVPVGPKSNHERYLDLLAVQIDAGAPDLTLLERSLAALEVCEAAYRSNHARCAVTLPLSEFLAPLPVEWTAGQPYSGTGGGRDGRRLDEVKHG